MPGAPQSLCGIFKHRFPIKNEKISGTERSCVTLRFLSLFQESRVIFHWANTGKICAGKTSLQCESRRPILLVGFTLFLCGNALYYAFGLVHMGKLKRTHVWEPCFAYTVYTDFFVDLRTGSVIQVDWYTVAGQTHLTSMWVPELILSVFSAPYPGGCYIGSSGCVHAPL